MLRISGSINSKYSTKVTIVQKWNGYRPVVSEELLEDFRTYLIQKKIDDDHNHEEKLLIDNKKRNKNYRCYHSNKNLINNNNYEWIEKLFETAIEDYRKYTMWKILCPYLVNTKKLPYEQSYKILKTWLEKCNEIRTLDFNPSREIKSKLKNVKHYNPLSIKKLKVDNKNLYFLLKL